MPLQSFSVRDTVAVHKPVGSKAARVAFAAQLRPEFDTKNVDVRPPPLDVQQGPACPEADIQEGPGTKVVECAYEEGEGQEAFGVSLDMFQIAGVGSGHPVFSMKLSVVKRH